MILNSKLCFVEGRDGGQTESNFAACKLFVCSGNVINKDLSHPLTVCRPRQKLK